jgi:putative tryptophan/tyrosine transport system substrate-binding protein
MKRRAFIAGLGSAAAWPVVARAQQPTTPVIGFLSSRSPGESTDVVAAFQQGLREAGFVEGQNLSIAFRWADGRYDRLPALAANLVDLRVSVIFAAGGQPSALAAKAAASAIPVVFSAVNDPVEIGLVASLARPGGNVTGMSVVGGGIHQKSMQLLNEVAPKARVIGYLVNPSNPTVAAYEKDALTAARALGLDVRLLKSSTERGLDEAFVALARFGAGGLVVPSEPFFDSQRDRIVTLSAQYAMPAIYTWREYVVAGGLISYGSSLTDSYRRAGIYAGRILRGEKPADLPVQEPIKFELAINLKTAKALGLTIPETLLATADEVIQ